ncbi:MAG: tetratricopeptide repeat protein [Thermoanaerobaculia bacterium]|jgi:tetratricopeptide (TPR) repeat protein
MTRASRTVVIAIVIALLGSSVAWAKEFYESYDEGLKAVETKEWNDVIAKMTEAIRKNPKENKRERSYGANFFPYHPYYYRGIAYFNLGKYPEAIDDLQKALGVGRINLGTPESWVLRAEDRMRYSAPQQPPQQVPQQQPQQPPPTTTVAPQQPQQQPTRPPVTQPQQQPTRPPVTQQPQQQQPTRPPVTQPPVQVPVTDTGALKAKVRDALRAYFSGDFQRSEIALELLSKEQESNAMIWAFLGASRYNGYILSGEANGTMKSGAEDAFRRARNLKPSLQLNAKYFSPRVRNFYESIE